jgi:hypothetical protein
MKITRVGAVLTTAIAMSTFVFSDSPYRDPQIVGDGFTFGTGTSLLPAESTAAAGPSAAAQAPAAPKTATVPGTEYRASDGSFTCHVPSGWKARATNIGKWTYYSRSGNTGGSVNKQIIFYPNGRFEYTATTFMPDMPPGIDPTTRFSGT